MLSFAELAIARLAQLGDLCGSFGVDGHGRWGDGRFEGEEGAVEVV